MSAESHSKDESQDEPAWLVRSAENRISGPFNLAQIRELIEHGKLQLGDEVCHARTYWFYLHEAVEVRSQIGIEIPKHLYAKTEEGTDTQTDTTDLEASRRAERPEAGATRMGSMSGAPSGSVVRPARQGVRPTHSSEATGSLPGEPELPELETGDDVGENTAVMSNRAFRDFRHKKTPASSPAPATHWEHSTPESRELPERTPPSGMAGMTGIAGRATHFHSTASGPRPRVLPVEKSKLVQAIIYVLVLGAIALILAVIKVLQTS